MLCLGRLPVCNGFNLNDNSQNADACRAVEIDVVECEACGLIQLRESAQPDLLRPRVPWIRYREPEGHLDQLARELLALRPNARTVIGAGPFEEPLLSRLVAHGMKTQALSLDAAPKNGCYPYLESWQSCLDDRYLTAISAEIGTFDIVCCRYIIEHASAPFESVRSLKRLLNPGGLLMIEVPDSARFLAARDYCFLWEEHGSYFVEETLRHLAEAGGCSVTAILRYSGATEDALVALLEPGEVRIPTRTAPGPSGLFEAYRTGFVAAREALRARLVDAAGPDRDGVAMVGIGHHAIMFVNAFRVADLIALAVDDDPNKVGFFPPGWRVPVVGSTTLLVDSRIRLCLLAVPPHVEAKLRDRLAYLVSRGVEFRSIYAAAEHSIMKDLAP